MDEITQAFSEQQEERDGGIYVEQLPNAGEQP